MGDTMTAERAEVVIATWRDITRVPKGSMSREQLRPSPEALRDLLQALAMSTSDAAWCGELIAMHDAVPPERRPIARALLRELIERLDKEKS